MGVFGGYEIMAKRCGVASSSTTAGVVLHCNLGQIIDDGDSGGCEGSIFNANDDNKPLPSALASTSGKVLAGWSTDPEQLL